jgi:hypothetical protein
MNEITDVSNLNEAKILRIIHYLEGKHRDSLSPLLGAESKQYVIQRSLGDYA